jgi:hypothetical protein
MQVHSAVSTPSGTPEGFPLLALRGSQGQAKHWLKRAQPRKHCDGRSESISSSVALTLCAMRVDWR